MTGQSKILAQTFTDSFIVYSAKRFPGVPGMSFRWLSMTFEAHHHLDTTALSIAFGNQGQKLPLVSTALLINIMVPYETDYSATAMVRDKATVGVVGESRATRTTTLMATGERLAIAHRRHSGLVKIIVSVLVLVWLCHSVRFALRFPKDTCCNNAILRRDNVMLKCTRWWSRYLLFVYSDENCSRNSDSRSHCSHWKTRRMVCG